MKMCDLRGLVAHRAPFRSNPVRNRVSTTAIQVRHSLLLTATIHGQGFINIGDVCFCLLSQYQNLKRFFLSCGSRGSSVCNRQGCWVNDRGIRVRFLAGAGYPLLEPFQPPIWRKSGAICLGGKTAWAVDHSFASTAGAQESCSYISTDPNFSMS
jgi:hypothetical protein